MLLIGPSIRFHSCGWLEGNAKENEEEDGEWFGVLVDTRYIL